MALQFIKISWTLLVAISVVITPGSATIDPVSTAKTVSTYVNVAKTLVNAFSRDEEKITDLTAADETVRGLTFDVFNEKTSCKVMKGIQLRDFTTVVERIAQRLQIPEDIKESILDGQYAEVNYEVVTDFKFSKGELGSFTYGRIVTVKRSGEVIDLAYSVYHLQYKLSPRVIEHKKKKKFLGFTIGKKVWRETFERNLSEKEQDHMRSYFLHKAIEGFRREYAGLIEADTCAENSDC